MDHESEIVKLLTEIRDQQRDNFQFAMDRQIQMMDRNKRISRILLLFMAIFVALMLWTVFGSRGNDRGAEDTQQQTSRI